MLVVNTCAPLGRAAEYRGVVPGLGCSRARVRALVRVREDLRACEGDRLATVSQGAILGKLARGGDKSTLAIERRQERAHTAQGHRADCACEEACACLGRARPKVSLLVMTRDIETRGAKNDCPVRGQ